MDNLKEHSDEFEDIAEKVVACLLEGVEADIRSTPSKKDGGYDIVAQCFDGTSQHKIYFECKLRSGNLNLRDIAANVVIAFNEGAVCLVAMTNCDYTPQLDKQLQQFYHKTILNIKIIIGAEIQKIITDNRIAVSKDLFDQFECKKNRRRKDSGLLRLDFRKSDLYKQFICKEPQRDATEDFFLTTEMTNQMNRAISQLQRGRPLLVKGFAGVGKSSFIKAVLQRFPCRTIYVDTLLYETKKQLLLDILVQIWGIPERKLLTGLTEEYVEAISAFLNGQENDEETTQIIRAILNGPAIGDIHSIQYNHLICHYILNLFTVHRHKYNYIVYVEHLQLANQEIQSLTVYLTKLLQKRQIGCIIESVVSEYGSGERPDPTRELIDLPNMDVITIKLLTPTQGVAFLLHTDPNLPKSSAQIIVDKVGSRPYNLALILEHFKQCGIDSGNPRQISREVEMLTPNDLPNIIGKVLPFYQGKDPSLFYLLGLLRGKLPLELLYDVVPLDEELDQLFNAQILVYSQENITTANEFILQQISQGLYPPKPAPLKVARELLARVEKDEGQYLWIQIRLLHYIQRYRETVSALDQYLAILWNARQYSALIEYLDIALDSAERLHIPERQADYLVQQLEAMVIKKEIAGGKASQRLEQLKQLLDNCSFKENRHTYQLAYDYFRGKQAFKSGRISTEEEIFEVNREHYEACVSGNDRENDGDWLGRICCIHALFIKELYGNDAALEIFEAACTALPESFELQREYNSHMGCMLLYINPQKAYEYYQTIIQAIGNHPTGALPFHEYGDASMSMLLAGRPSEALVRATEGIAFADSYGVTDEVGRIANIKGCVLLRMDLLAEAREQFVEATVVMERSGYYLYRWRSRLNLVQMELAAGQNSEKQLDLLFETYFDFMHLLRTKLQDLSSTLCEGVFQTREYHALLAFGRCFRLLGRPMEEKIASTFGLGELSPVYLRHVETLVAHPEKKVIEDSPYFAHGIIFMVG